MFQEIIDNNKLIKIVECRHRTFDVRKKDYKEMPIDEDMQKVHICDDIEVYQQRKGFKRFHKILI